MRSWRGEALLWLGLAHLTCLTLVPMMTTVVGPHETRLPRHASWSRVHNRDSFLRFPCNKLVFSQEILIKVKEKKNEPRGTKINPANRAHRSRITHSHLPISHTPCNTCLPAPSGLALSNWSPCFPSSQPIPGSSLSCPQKNAYDADWDLSDTTGLFVPLSF